jgi:hypothetical protein
LSSVAWRVSLRGQRNDTRLQELLVPAGVALREAGSLRGLRTQAYLPPIGPRRATIGGLLPLVIGTTYSEPRADPLGSPEPGFLWGRGSTLRPSVAIPPLLAIMQTAFRIPVHPGQAEISAWFKKARFRVARPESSKGVGCGRHALRRLRACHPGLNQAEISCSRA